MKTSARSLALALAMSLLILAGGSADALAARPSTTKQLPGVPCSVTASFTQGNGDRTMSYAGGVSCAGGIGQKTIDVVPQVFNNVNGRPLWFSIGAAGLYQGPTPSNPLRLSAVRAAVAGHVYRLLVYAHVALPDGRSSSATVCPACTGSPTLSIGPSQTYAAQPPTSTQMHGIPCSLGQHGLTFTLVNNTYVISYGGYAWCAGSEPLARRSLTICAQVANRINGKAAWFTITGSCLSQASTRLNPLALNTARAAYLGHGYRVKASATIQYPGSHGTTTTSATLYSARAAP